MSHPTDMGEAEGTNSEGKGTRPSRFDTWKAPVAIAIGFILGETIGKDVGANFAGFGKISGARLGEWIGFATGISLAVTIVGLFMTKSEASTRTRQVVSYIAVSFCFFLSAFVAVIAEAKIGEFGGSLAFLAFWIIAISAGYSFSLQGK